MIYVNGAGGAGLPAWIGALRAALAEGGSPSGVELIETHISWVLLSVEVLTADEAVTALRFDAAPDDAAAVAQGAVAALKQWLHTIAASPQAVAVA